MAQQQASLPAGNKPSQASSQKVSTVDTPIDAKTPSRTSQYYTLGLGRGVNVTDPHMWRNKSAFCVREPSLENTIKTKDCGTGDSSGMVERYRKEVSTHTVELQKIRLSLDSPSSHVKIDMDAQQTQSSHNEVVISGSKIRTETISFVVDFADVPRFTSLERAIQHKEKEKKNKNSKKTEKMNVEHEVPEEVPHVVEKESDEEEKGSFEDNLCSWILDRILDRPLTIEVINKVFGDDSAFKIHSSPAVLIMRVMHQLQHILVTAFEPRTGDSEETKEKLKKSKNRLKQELDTITKDCKGFVENLGVTHYVSSIDLGAMKYRSSEITSEQQKLGAGAGIGVSSVARGAVSGVKEKLKFSKSEEEQMIGKMNKEETEVVDKAVIGFQIQPIYELVRVRGLQPALQQAVKEYIIEKGDNSEGPFQIGCTIRKLKVYWKVDEENRVVGTKSSEKASLFYIIPTNDPKHPSEFYIAYWGQKKGDRKHLTNLNDPLVTKVSSLPLYLSTNTDIFGYSKGPLMVKPQVLTEHARFCLHSRVLSTFACMCLSTPVSLQDWIDGEQFYINCTRRAFKIDGYIAMCEDKPQMLGEVMETAEPATETKYYKTVTRPSMNDPNMKEDVGILFRLYPPVPVAQSQQEDFPVITLREKPKQSFQIDSEQEVPMVEVMEDKDSLSAPENGSTEESRVTDVENSATVVGKLTINPADTVDVERVLRSRRAALQHQLFNPMSQAGQFQMFFGSPQDD